MVLAIVACEARASGKAGLTVDSTTTGHGTEIIIGPSLDSIARNNINRIDTLRSDWSTRGNNNFGHIADVAVWSDERFAVLDRLNQRIVLFSGTGLALRNFGRKGSGPGEFRDPLALDVAGSTLIVWDGGSTVFTALDTLGDVVATATTPIAGDWRPNVRRASTFRLEHPLSAPWEDITRRLRQWSDSEFVHQIQLDERAVARSDPILRQPPVRLIRYDASLTVRDTVWQSVAPPSLPLLGGNFSFQQPVYARRPLWTAGDGWWANAPPDSNHVNVHLHAGNGIRIAFRESVSRPSKKLLERTYVQWYLAEDVMRNTPKDHQQRIQSISKWQLRKQTKALTRVLAFADHPPLITALYGRGTCLWIAGFNEDDTPDGSARTLLGLDVSTMESRVIKVGQKGHRIREVSEKHVFTTYRDSDNVIQLERFVLPKELQCKYDRW